MESNIFYALILTLLAGLATAIGGLISLLLGKTGSKHLAIILGFSVGVMIYISFVELLPLAIEQAGHVTANIAFFVGIAFLAVLDVAIPHEYKGERIKSSHHLTTILDNNKVKTTTGKPSLLSKTRSSLLMRTGFLTALGIGIHNVPEGLAVFSSAMAGNISLGIMVAVAVALHNIPEGICVFAPIYEASGNRKKAFLATLFSGLAEPVGALLGFAILLPFLSPILISSLLAFAAGVMVYISLDELLPAAHEYGESHLIIIGVGVGMLVMAISFMFFQ